MRFQGKAGLLKCSLFSTRTWIETDFQELVRSRRAAVVSRMKRTTAMSCSHGILSVLKAWNGLGAGNEVFSLGVLCSGNKSCICISIWNYWTICYSWHGVILGILCRLLWPPRWCCAFSPTYLHRWEMVRTAWCDHWSGPEGEASTFCKWNRAVFKGKKQ